jgi:chromosome partitioning protein
MSYITAIVNQKGGVGKTTTAINLSAGLAISGCRVLLIDLDPQANTTRGLGVEPESHQRLMNDVLVNKVNIRSIILKTSVEGLDLAPSHLRLDRAEQLLTQEMFREERLYKAIRNLDYDHILIDCRPTLGTLTVNALFASHFILVPCEMSRYSLEGFTDLMDTISAVKNCNTEEKKRFVRIVLTRFDVREKLTNEWVLSQLDTYQGMIFETRIRRTQALNQAHIASKPIFDFDPKSNGAEDYTNLTKEFKTLCKANATN